MEIYPRGRRGSPAKGVVRETGARVQIPQSPPQKRELLSTKSSLFVFDDIPQQVADNIHAFGVIGDT